MKLPIANRRLPIDFGCATACLETPERGLSQSAAHGRQRRFGIRPDLRLGETLRVGTTRAPFKIGNRRSAIGNHAFTLIEIMIVVGIIGLLAAMGLPSLSKALQKEGMRKAVSDIQDVCFSAREQAIVGNKKVAVVFYPRENRFGVEGTTGTNDQGTVINTHSGKTLVATLPDGVQFGMLDIFRQDYVQSDWAKIFFNADGTCDEAVIVLLSKGRAQKITLEYATGMPVVSAVDQ